MARTVTAADRALAARRRANYRDALTLDNSQVLSEARRMATVRGHSTDAVATWRMLVSLRNRREVRIRAMTGRSRAFARAPRSVARSTVRGR